MAGEGLRLRGEEEDAEEDAEEGGVDGRQCVATGDQVASSLHSMATRGSEETRAQARRQSRTDGRHQVRPPPGGPAGDSRSENKSFSRAGNLSTTCEAVQNLPAVSNALSLPDISRSPPPSPTASIRTSSGERRVQAHVADNGI